MHPIYDKLSRIGFLSRSYSFKFLFVAFLGIHVPLIGLIIFVLFASHMASVSTILLTTLLLTLGATAATLLILNGLLSPLRESQQTLKNYLNENALPQLPLIYYDEAGQLMQHIQITITELNSVLEEKKDLTALLSHDLRIPLRNVQTFADLIQRRNVSVEEAKEIAAGISESAREQQQLLETILEILRMDYLFKDKAMLQPVSIEEIISDVMLAMKTMADDKGIILAVDFQYSDEIKVHPELFKQVIKNLVSNAIKFSHAASEVNLVVRRDGSKTVIDVIDSGIGFTEEIGTKLFDRFTSAGRKGTAGEQTTGLGLYLSRKIVRHQQGEIEAYSAGADQGARFSVSLRM